MTIDYVIMFQGGLCTTLNTPDYLIYIISIDYITTQSSIIITESNVPSYILRDNSFDTLQWSSVRKYYLTTNENPSGANLKPLSERRKREIERLSTRAVLQQAEFRSLHYYRVLKLFVECPILGLWLTNAATWQKEAEFSRILKKITRKPNRSFQSKIFHLWAQVPPWFIGHHSRLEVHLRKEVYILWTKVRNLFVVQSGLLTE